MLSKEHWSPGPVERQLRPVQGQRRGGADKTPSVPVHQVAGVPHGGVECGPDGSKGPVWGPPFRLFYVLVPSLFIDSCLKFLLNIFSWLNVGLLINLRFNMFYLFFGHYGIYLGIDVNKTSHLNLRPCNQRTWKSSNKGSQGGCDSF